MHNVALFRDRPLVLRIITGGVVPALFGAAAGIVLGVSAGGYWAMQLVALAGGIFAGFEHADGWDGADRGLAGGAIFGTGLLVAHAIAGTDEKVTLPSFEPILVIFTAIIGLFAGALGGRLRRAAMERESSAGEAQLHDEQSADGGDAEQVVATDRPREPAL
jgi:hypothetical protein